MKLSYLTVEGIWEWYNLLMSNIAMCRLIFPEKLAYLTVEGICEWYHLLISNIAMCLVIFTPDISLPDSRRHL